MTGDRFLSHRMTRIIWGRFVDFVDLERDSAMLKRAWHCSRCSLGSKLQENLSQNYKSHGPFHPRILPLGAAGWHRACPYTGSMGIVVKVSDIHKGLATRLARPRSPYLFLSRMTRLIWGCLCCTPFFGDGRFGCKRTIQEPYKAMRREKS